MHHLKKYKEKETHVTNGCRLTQAEIRALYFAKGQAGSYVGYEMAVFDARYVPSLSVPAFCETTVCNPNSLGTAIWWTPAFGETIICRENPYLPPGAQEFSIPGSSTSKGVEAALDIDEDLEASCALSDLGSAERQLTTSRSCLMSNWERTIRTISRIFCTSK